MNNINYANMTNELLGDELYCKFLKEIAKDNKGMNLVDFGKEVVEKCCLIIVKLGLSKKIRMDSVKICLENEIVEVSCREFANKYKEYLQEIEKNI